MKTKQKHVYTIIIESYDEDRIGGSRSIVEKIKKTLGPGITITAIAEQQTEEHTFYRITGEEIEAWDETH